MDSRPGMFPMHGDSPQVGVDTFTAQLKANGLWLPGPEDPAPATLTESTIPIDTVDRPTTNRLVLANTAPTPEPLDTVNEQNPAAASPVAKVEDTTPKPMPAPEPSKPVPALTEQPKDNPVTRAFKAFDSSSRIPEIPEDTGLYDTEIEREMRRDGYRKPVGPDTKGSMVSFPLRKLKSFAFAMTVASATLGQVLFLQTWLSTSAKFPPLVSWAIALGAAAFAEFTMVTNTDNGLDNKVRGNSYVWQIVTAGVFAVGAAVMQILHWKADGMAVALMFAFASFGGWVSHVMDGYIRASGYLREKEKWDKELERRRAKKEQREDREYELEMEARRKAMDETTDVQPVTETKPEPQPAPQTAPPAKPAAVSKPTPKPEPKTTKQEVSKPKSRALVKRQKDDSELEKLVPQILRKEEKEETRLGERPIKEMFPFLSVREAKRLRDLKDIKAGRKTA